MACERGIFKKGIIWGLLIFFLMIASTYGQEKRFKLVFLNPADPKDNFWALAEETLMAASQDLGIDVVVYYAKRNRELMKRQMKGAVKKDKPDAFVCQSLKKNGVALLKIAEKAKIPLFMFNAGLVGKDKKKHGEPREKFKYWIGQMLPNDEVAANDLAHKLFEIAGKKGFEKDSGKFHTVALLGLDSDFAGVERKKGLKRAIKENGRVKYYQGVPASWNRKDGKRVFKGLIMRYPKSQIFWAANDQMGLGAIDGAKEANLALNNRIIIGSIDWIPEALNAIKNGELAVSVGGHFLEAAWAVVLVHDYLNGIDFGKAYLNSNSRMGILTEENIDIYLNNLGQGEWNKVDFSRFSKKRNPSLKAYDFSIDAVLAQF